MADSSRRNQSLTEGDVSKLLRDMAGPMVVGISCLIIVGITDTYFAKFLGTKAQAALGVSTPIMMIANSLILGATGGASSLLSRTIGAGRPNKAKAIARDIILFLTVAATLLSCMALLLREPLLSLLQASEDLQSLTLPYLSLYFIGFPVASLAMITSGLLRTHGERFLPPCMLVIAAVINIVLDPFLLFGWGPFPELGLKGLALASIVAWGISACVGLFFAVFRRKYIAIDWSRAGSIGKSLTEISRLAFPASLANALGPVGAFLAVSAIFVAGEAAVAGYGVGARIEAFVSIPFFALTSALSPVSGQNTGAQRYDRVREAFYATYKMCFIWGSISAIILMLFAPFFVSLLSDDPEAISAGTFYLRINCLFLFGAGMAMNAAAGFNGAGEPVRGMLVTLVRSIILTGPLAWIGAVSFGLWGAFAGIALANLLAGCVALAMTNYSMTAIQKKANEKLEDKIADTDDRPDVELEKVM